MRCIGLARSLNITKRFSLYLRKEKIDSVLFPSQDLDGLWQTWVIDEDQVQRAQDLWQEFQDHAGHIEIDDNQIHIDQLQTFERKNETHTELKFERTWPTNRSTWLKAPLTHFIAAACCMQFAFNNSNLPSILNFQKKINLALIEKTRAQNQEIVEELLSDKFPVKKVFHPTLSNQILLKKGAIWKLFAVSFYHDNFCQMAFSLAWFLIFARQIEEKAGWGNFLIIFLISSFAANFAELALFGACRGGVASVVWALAAFLAMRRRYFAWEDYRIAENIVHFLQLFIAFDFALQILAIGYAFQKGHSDCINFACAGQFLGFSIGASLGKIHSMGMKKTAKHRV